MAGPIEKRSIYTTTGPWFPKALTLMNNIVFKAKFFHVESIIFFNRRRYELGSLKNDAFLESATTKVAFVSLVALC